MLGLQSALGVALKYSGCSVQRVIELMSWAPARIAGLTARQGNAVASGNIANLVVFNPAAEWEQSLEQLVSKSQNTPYLGLPLQGQVQCVVRDGKVIVEAGVIAK
jgi:dihydroorotase